MLRWLLISALLLTTVCRVAGQVPASTHTRMSNLRQLSIPVQPGRMQLDSLSIVPNSVRVIGVPDSLFQVDWINGSFQWLTLPPFDSVLVRYRVFNTRINAPGRVLNFDSILNKYVSQLTIGSAQNSKKDDDFFDFGNITYNGSFGRGISFGNAQDAVVSSNLNLQLNGYLADSIGIAAAITDNNIPIQPDGTTQQLNEFDRIFLQFRKKGWQLNLGDIDIRQDKNYFLHFYKRLQGASFENHSRLSDRITNHSLVSGSIAKGKFTRNVFNGLEGNQGPYRLTGASNELYFIVLAGTERVFLDGELLQRGEDRDYVINYNTAEITFTPRRMISKDKRIQVEFEYADRNYLNTNLYLANETSLGERFRLRLGAFSNNDARNSPIHQELDGSRKQFLANVGDSISKAFYPVASIDSFSSGKILYKKVEVYVNGVPDSIYVYSTNPDSALYNLNFVDVGEGNGNYLPDLNAANGKVFRWVEPINGRPGGRYEAATFLVTPKQQQVLTIGADYVVANKTTISADIGMSNYNTNTFSVKDKGNDKGFASRMVVKHSIDLGRNLLLRGDGSVEWVEKTFKPLERLRNVEFTRDWGLPLVTTPADETIYTAAAELADSKENKVRYQLTGYDRSDGFRGIRNTLQHTQENSGWKFNNLLSITRAEGLEDKGYFFRPTIDVAKRFGSLKNLTAGFVYSLEHNEARNKMSDSITPYSFSFDVVKFYVRSDEQKPDKWTLSYHTRSDKIPMGKDLVRTDRSQNFSLEGELFSNAAHQIRVTTTFRTLQVYQKTNANLQSDKSLLGRLEYLINEWKGMLTGNLLYDLGAGQEQKRDFVFLEVPAGQGEYAWFDYNEDGVQQLNEFEIAVFQDQARYIRIFTPTNEFVKAAFNSFNYSLSLNPAALIDPVNAGAWGKFLSRINVQSSLQLFRKQLSDGISHFNPFENSLNDSSLISLTSVWVNSFAFNRSSSSWGFDISNTRNNGKLLLTYGLESRSLEEWILRNRWNLARKFTLETTFRTGNTSLYTASAKFDNRNYEVDQYSLEPRLTYTYGSNFRVGVGYRYGNKTNRQGEREAYRSHAYHADMKFNLLQNAALQGRFTYNRIGFPFATNTTVSYIMLDGLQPGKNLLWNLDLSKRLGKNLEMNLQYEGRKPGDNRTIHVGRAALRAIL